MAVSSPWQAEESIPLRILVQLVVFAGIAAVDIVAGTSYSVWAIPLSAIASVWGWYARHRRNIPVKFCIAIAMIAMLVVFLQDLLAQTEETRVLLARLLIQLQVLHSFDLPRRKDLGYSVVIGFILLSVAATISQTMIFALCLMVFLVLAVPFLILDHRSRLGIVTREFALQQSGINPVPLLGLLTLVVVLGLMIFALLPRFSGFQLRNFPVSVNINVQRDIPRGSIITRAPAGSGEGGNTVAPDGEGGTGAGGAGGTGTDERGENDANNRQVLPPLFGTEIDASRSRPEGEEIEPQLVMRVRSQAGLFWRMMSYDEYTGKGWRISRNQPEQIYTLKRPSWSYEFQVQHQPPSLMNFVNSVYLREVIQSYTITVDRFPNVIPAATIPYRLFFPSDEVDLDMEGNLRSPGSIPKDLTYTVISGVPIRDANLLRRVRLRPNRTLSRYYLQLPNNPELRQELQATVNKLLADQEITNMYDATVAITEAVRANYRLQSLSIDEGKDLVTEFLRQGGGQPQQFVSTLVLLLRSVGIPARYTVGFGAGKFNPFTGLYEVYNTDAQSLVEVYFLGFGWLTFDPVPGRPMFPPSVEDDRTFSVWQGFWEWLSGVFPPLRHVWEAIAGFAGWLLGILFAGGWSGVITGIMVVFGVVLTLWGLWQVWQWGREWWYVQRLHPIQRVYANMLKHLAEQGLGKSPHQTPLEYWYSLQERLALEQWLAGQKIIQAYQDWHYGDRLISEQELGKLWREFLRCGGQKKLLKKG